jgi:lysophospholipase
LTASDGVRLRVARWGNGNQPMVAIFPGRTEVIEKYGPTVTDLVVQGYDVAVIDWRGQGLSDRLCHPAIRGDVPDFAHYQRDVQAYLAWLSNHGGAPYILAHSMGGCIALRAMMDGLPARAIAFSAPMWGLFLPRATLRMVPVATRVLRALGQDTRAVPGASEEFEMWNFPFERNELTRDRDTYAWAQHQLVTYPDLRLGAPSMRWLAAAVREMQVLATRPAPAVPAICGLGTGDKIIGQDAVRDRMANWPNGRLLEFDGALHELLLERDDVRAAFLGATLDLFRAHPATNPR